MKIFSKKVDLRSREGMINFLSAHFRYNTMNSWNCSTSYAHNVKIYNLGLEKEQENKLYELTGMSEFYERIEALFWDFARQHNFLWQVGFNGRNSGYLVLYKGFAKQSEYKSYCTECGQRNHKTTEETENCICGRCGRETRVNYSVVPKEYGIYPGKNTDMNEDFEDWDIYSIRERVRLVQSFDRLCDDVFSLVKDIISNFEIEEEMVYVPKTVKTLREAS